MPYTLLEKFHTGSADDMQNNFQHIAAGSLVPRGGNLLEPTTGAYDLGSDAARWNQAYVNTINLGSGTVSRCMNMIAEVTLTATASSIEFTGLNGETDVIYEINCNIKAYADVVVFLFPNSDSTTNNYGYQRFRGASTAAEALRVTSNTGILVARPKDGTTTSLYSKAELIIYANNNLKLILNKEAHGIGNTYVDAIYSFGQVWNNSATLTSMKFTGSFDPNTHISIWAKR